MDAAHEALFIHLHWTLSPASGKGEHLGTWRAACPRLSCSFRGERMQGEAWARPRRAIVGSQRLVRHLLALLHFLWTRPLLIQQGPDIRRELKLVFLIPTQRYVYWWPRETHTDVRNIGQLPPAQPRRGIKPTASQRSSQLSRPAGAQRS